MTIQLLFHPAPVQKIYFCGFLLLPCLLTTMSVTQGSASAPSHQVTQNQTETDSSGTSRSLPRPCCFPPKFEATVTSSLLNIGDTGQQVTLLHRDWQRRLQVQETALLSKEKGYIIIRTVFMDFQRKVQYVYGPTGPCQKMDINFGMLEPCMPEDAAYLGNGYLGAFNDSTHFQGWRFQRTDQNRNVDMMVFVTADRCVPVAERISGHLGGNPIQMEVVFLNVSQQVDESIFNLPVSCQTISPM